MQKHQGQEELSFSQLEVSVGPHIVGSQTIAAVMKDVIIALVPAVAAAAYFFGTGALLRVAAGIAACVAIQWVWQKATKRTVTVNDLSAVVTGILLVLTLPPAIPYWLVALGSVSSIIIGKEIFGGLGHNPFNPALIGRAILSVSYPGSMSQWLRPIDGITAASPLEIVKMNLPGALPSYQELFLGLRAGSLGETSVLALLAGAVYLVARKQIRLVIPLSFIGTVAAGSYLLGHNPLFHAMAGGLILGAFFMATDIVTCPLTYTGKLIFGIGCGIITLLIRLYGSMPEGVCYAILVMNMTVPILDMYCRPRLFGNNGG